MDYSKTLIIDIYTISIDYCLIYGCYDCNVLGYKLKVCATKRGIIC